jgi:hypothetical protein
MVSAAFRGSPRFDKPAKYGGWHEHRRIATHATRAKTLQRAQRLLVLVIVALLAAVLMQLLISGGQIRP